jgi:2-polyprenyl-3-methyl-5-hydroxy-6-metoxy-1,4-benzoquinol methylase
MSEQVSSARPRGDVPDIEYGSSYFRHDCGVPYERNQHWLDCFDRIAESIVRDLRPTSVLDAGCAMGFLVEALRKRGVEAWGIDISEYAIEQADESVREHCRVASITEPLDRRYDLTVCIEVLEHIPPAEADAAIANLCAASDRLLISSTPEDRGEATHLNVRPVEAWSAAMAREGFLRDVDRDTSYLTPWAALYTRSEESLEETVRRYDRSWWHLREETRQLRESLLSANERIAEMEARAEDPAESQSEADRRKQEIFRLRDLLVGKDVELGVARGRLAAHEERAERLASAAAQVQARIPMLGRLSGPLLRRLRGHRS